MVVSLLKSSVVLAAVAAETNLTEILQGRLDSVIAKLHDPNLTISFAWKDADGEIAVAAGTAFANGRATTVHDTFLFGSGTKPFTAAAVMRMIDAGLVKADDQAQKYIDPYLARHGKPSLAAVFGEQVRGSTVLGLVNMSAGIRDFEADYHFDDWVLGNGSRWWDYPYEAMNWSVSEANVAADGGAGPMECEPGTCIAYSSTSFDVAGLLLVSVLQPEKPWYEFDLGSAVFPDRSKVPSMRFPPLGNASAVRLSEYLTIPGTSESKRWGTAVIHEQDPSVLGWTCGNAVARPVDVARFFYSLLQPGAPDPVVSNVSRARMTALRKTTAGWLKANLKYGVGLMETSIGGWRFRNRITGVGHDGQTYGFQSKNGYIAELGGTYSFVVNGDGRSAGLAQAYGLCDAIESIKRVLTGDDSFSLGCLNSEDDIIV